MMNELPIEAEYVRELSFAKSSHALRDRIEDGLHICRRAADDLEDLGGSGFPSISVAELALQLVDHAPKVLTSSRCRQFGRHDNVQSFECSAKLARVPEEAWLGLDPSYARAWCHKMLLQSSEFITGPFRPRGASKHVSFFVHWHKADGLTGLAPTVSIGGQADRGRRGPCRPHHALLRISITSSIDTGRGLVSTMG